MQVRERAYWLRMMAYLAASGAGRTGLKTVRLSIGFHTFCSIDGTLFVTEQTGHHDGSSYHIARRIANSLPLLFTAFFWEGFSGQLDSVTSTSTPDIEYRALVIYHTSLQHWPRTMIRRVHGTRPSQPTESRVPNGASADNHPFFLPKSVDGKQARAVGRLTAICSIFGLG
jgi:hypothetical protein